MLELPLLYAVFAVLAAALALLAVWSRRSLRARAGAVSLMAITLVAGYVAYADLLSRPKPAALEVRRSGVAEADVLAAALREDVGIYLWLRLPDFTEPRYYVLPWNRALAQQLQDAMRKADRNDSTIRMRYPFEPSLELRDAPRYYALPQPKLPDKPHPPPLDYNHPSLSI